MEIILSTLIGVGLAASCGFKVFVPFLIISIASISGNIELAKGFTWIGTYPALVAFGIATIIEIAAYYIPFIDNLLDLVSAPVTVVCGVIVTASCIQGVSPLLAWSIAAILGGTVAGGTKMVNSGIRATSTATTGGLGNFLVNTGQIIMSLLIGVIALLVPFIICIVIAIIIVKLIKINKKRRARAC